MLKRGSSGSEVVELQKRLKEKGFDPGDIDGNFGDRTEAAVIAFQKSKNLLPDGIAGPETRLALGMTQGLGRAAARELFTIDVVAKMFFDAPRRNIEKYLPLVLDALEEVGLGDRDMILMALATIRAETAGFEPISEFRSRFNTSPNGHPFDLYDFRSDLGHGAVGDGAKYKGRGFIQLTGRFNYQRHGEAIGLGNQLVENPDLANDPKIAARLLASFLKDAQRSIREALLVSDFRGARRAVNGGSHGLDQFTQAFQTGASLAEVA